MKLNEKITIEISGYELNTIIDYNENQATIAEACDYIESSKWHDNRIKELKEILEKNYGN